MGSCFLVDTWCKMASCTELDAPKTHVVKREDFDSTTDGNVVTTDYKRVDGELKEVLKTLKDVI